MLRPIPEVPGAVTRQAGSGRRRKPFAALAGRRVVRFRQPEPCHPFLAESAYNRERPHEGGQLLDQPLRTVSDDNRHLEGLAVDLTVEQHHRVAALAHAESVGGYAEDGVHGFEQVRDGVTACDRMDEDRTVEDHVRGEQVGESFGRWLGAAHVLELMTCQSNPLGSDRDERL